MVFWLTGAACFASWPAVAHAMQYWLEQTSPRRTALTLLNINQTNGFHSPGCARPEPPPRQQQFHQHCENGIKRRAKDVRPVSSDRLRLRGVVPVGNKRAGPLVSVEEIGNTPTSKGVFVRLEPAGRQEALGGLCDRRTLC
jgi:hypothetical protein